VMALLSPAGDSAAKSCGDGAAKATLVTARCRCRVMLAKVLPRQLGRGVM
jgi:hypothetical protein